MQKNCYGINFVYDKKTPKAHFMQKLKLTLLLILGYMALVAQVIDPAFAPRILRASNNHNIAAVQVDNKLLVTASIKGYVNNESVGLLFRVHEDGEVDRSFQYPSQLSAPFRVGVQKDGKIIIAGNFKTSTGAFLGNLMRLLPNGTIDQTFASLSKETFSINQLVILPNQKIFVSGFLPRPDGKSGVIYHALLMLPDGTIDKGFPELFFSTESNSPGVIDDIDFQSNNELIIAGSNFKVGNRTQKLLRVDSLGKVDTLFNPVFTNTFIFNLRNIAILADGTIGVLSGDFNTVTVFDRNGKRIFSENLRNEFAFLHPLGKRGFIILGKSHYEVYHTTNSYSKREDFGVNDYIFNAETQAEGRIVFAGQFTQVGNRFKAGIARIKAGDNIFSSFDDNFKAGFYAPGVVSDALKQKDEKIVIGGYFHLINGTRVNHIARLMPNGQLDPSFNQNLANINRGVNKIKQQSNGNFVVGGTRTPDFDGLLNGIDIIDKDGNFIRSLSYPYYGLITSILYLDVDANDRIYAGENIAYRDGLGNSGQTLARYSANGVLEANYNDLYINSLVRYNGLIVQPDRKLLIFGHSLRYDNSDTTAMIRALPNGLRDSRFATEVERNAYATSGALLSTGEIVLGGYTRKSDNINRSFLIKLDSLGKKSMNFNANIGTNPDRPSIVSFLTKLPLDHLLISGSFDQYNGRSVNKNFIIDKNGKFIADFFPNLDNPRFSSTIIINENSYYLGGSFIAPNGAVSFVKISAISTSINKPESKLLAKKSKIFPNPIISGKLSLELNSALVETDLQFQICELATGRIVQSGRIPGKPFTAFDLKTLANGSYVLRLIGEKWEETHVFNKIK